MIIIGFLRLACCLVWLDYKYGATNPLRIIAASFRIIREDERYRKRADDPAYWESP